MGYGMYLFFTATNVLNVLYLIYSLPETKNVPLEEMDRLFAKGLRPQNANGVCVRAKNNHIIGGSEGNGRECLEGSVKHRSNAGLE